MKNRLRAIVSRSHSPTDGSLFQRIRWRLVAWYTGAMLAALVVLGVVLYIAMRQTLLAPITDDLREQAREQVELWQSMPVSPSCPMMHESSLWACYDPAGNLVSASRLAQLSPAFTDPSLAKRALHGGTATDTIDTGPPFGSLQRYAISAQDGHGDTLGALVIGASIGGERHALDVLLSILIVLGTVMVGATGVGGVLLADSMLRPARVAHRRQRDFIADASHELRTPLTMLRADAEVLLRGREHMSRDDVAILEDIVKETVHMAALADTMLDLARLDAGEARLEQDVVDLSDVAGEIARRAAARATESGVSVQVDADRGALVIGDRLLLEEALLALVDNGIKYNRPGGQVTFTVRAVERTVSVTVTDTGIGIPPEHLSHLGERFYRVDKARSRAMGGAGLGLSIVQRIIQLHGGSFKVESQPEIGTTVTLNLPAASNAVTMGPEYRET